MRAGLVALGLIGAAAIAVLESLPVASPVAPPVTTTGAQAADEPAALPREGIAIEGTVVYDNGRAAPDMVVVARWPRAKPGDERDSFDARTWNAWTDERGRFRVIGVEAGEYDLTAETWGHGAAVVAKTVEALRVRAPAKGVRITAARPGSAVLRLLLPDGRPYSGPISVDDGEDRTTEDRGTRTEVDVYVVGRTITCGWASWMNVDSDDTVPERERTTRDGRISLTGIGPRRWWISLSVDGFLPAGKTFVPPPGSMIDLGDLTLDPGIELRGRVTDLTGKPVSGARVGCLRTDENGSFRIERLPAGPLTFHLHGLGVDDTEQVVDVRPAAAPVVVALAAGALVRVVARHADGRSAESERLAVIRLLADGKPDTETLATRRTAEDGRITWRLPTGRWHVFRGEVDLWNEDLSARPYIAEWTLVEGETKDVELTFPAR